MANFQDHYQIPLDGMDSQHVTRKGWFTSSHTFCLVLSVISTLSVFTLTFYSTSTSQSTSLFTVVKPKTGLTRSPFTSLRNKKNIQPRWIPAKAGDFEPGQKAEYYSTSNGRWIPVTVEEVNDNGAVQIDVKRGTWISTAEQEKGLRKVNALKAFFTNSDFNFGGDTYGKGKGSRVEDQLGSSDLYDPNSKAYFYARAREQRAELYGKGAGQARAQTPKERNAQRDAEGPPKPGSWLGQVTGALDFQENIKEDQGLLRSASQLRRGEKMSREEYGAVQRKVGGTKGGFFGQTVDVQGAYTDKGYVSEEDKLKAQQGGPWWKKLR